jgi:predicted anti-sigma-YlaC factor YlaD
MLDSVHQREIENHLASCEECRRTLERMRRQSALFQTLQPAAEIDPAPGFYARVLDRIESQRIPSVWDLLIEPVFARRLAYVSLTLLAILGVFMFTADGVGDPSELVFSSHSPEVILAEEPVVPVLGDDVDHDRSVVLVNLATYQD